MVRRDFLQRLTAAGATGLATSAKLGAGATRTVTYQIKGFTCVTCAVGLEVMLREQKGITLAKASYPERRVIIGFDTGLTNEASIREFINRTGFTATVANQR